MGLVFFSSKAFSIFQTLLGPNASATNRKRPSQQQRGLLLQPSSTRMEAARDGTIGTTKNGQKKGKSIYFLCGEEVGRALAETERAVGEAVRRNQPLCVAGRPEGPQQAASWCCSLTKDLARRAFRARTGTGTKPVGLPRARPNPKGQLVGTGPNEKTKWQR